ncbi:MULTISPECIES: glycosyltransferase family 4 protein [unclassified Marinobacterium]|uniref:glycosyltransferase family 4 protein n=1 Tax=unclassified Marinobacterium TaxID=2644139 RepID=UPI0019E44A75|nr:MULTISPECIES: glycosyltransferase family 4 protein [unclassified Marinobacterium]NRP53641.1 N,N'-diacetylbacillosaminyl-diphospho-undecaprenol alpha-1,3-N-acetylgalactosaminyltransferase [Marinobacterium sp. xm-v-242]NRP77891.1 N,N'-diacetylbacillosaminyl-diphospho-undecaprenol alpha-1,3-N-acetylgalactosaminyltransferase [Marinobacterium sp. xm-m-383]
MSTSSPKTVFIVANTLFTVINFRSELIALLQSRGYRVVVLCPSSCSLSPEDESVANQLNEMGVEHVAISLSRQGLDVFAELRLGRELYKTFRSYRPYAVLNYTIKPVIYASLAAKLAGVPVISSNITGLGYVFTDNSLKAKALKTIVKLLYRVSLWVNTVVFFQNKDDLKVFAESKMVNSNKAVLLNGSGVNLSFFKFNPDKSVRKGGCTKVLFIGRLLKDKGIRELLDAAYLLRPENIEIILVGGLDDNPNSIGIASVNKAVSDGVVRYEGTVPDVRGLLEEADVFVLPSYREGTPRSTLEALASGLPIVTTDVPGCRETVIDGYNGFLVEPYSHEALASKILELHQNPNLFHDMRLRSREMAEKKFDVNAINERIVSACNL